MVKLLSVKPCSSENLHEIYQHITNNFFFDRKAHTNAIIAPYCVVTDGTDIIAFVDDKAVIDIGFECFIEKSDWSKKLSFDNQIEKIVHQSFFKQFEGVNLHLDEIKVINSQQAFYDLNKTVAYPIIFISLPHNKPVNIPCNSNWEMAQVPLKEFIRNGLVKYTLSYPTKVATYYLQNGEIEFPLIKIGDEFNE